jgi:peptidoglycan/LPS O-acetylase OafA/YrhL
MSAIQAHIVSPSPVSLLSPASSVSPATSSESSLEEAARAPARARVSGAASSVSLGPFSIAIGYLRAFVTLLVVAHHAVLAYHPFAPGPTAFVAEPRWWQVFPIVDSQRWSGFTLLVAFNDMFFMALMFFLSGLFVWTSLRRKGPATFLRDRAVRLGLPFIVAAGVLAPLAYYPSYLAASAAPSLAEFWTQWLSLGTWPAGPAWFIWVLLAFDVLAAGVCLLTPTWGDTLGRWVSRIGDRPLGCFAILVAASAMAYVPMAMIVGPMQWSSVGPFAVQTSRVLHYALYFVAGIALGASGADRGVVPPLLAPDGRLARRWLRWAATTLVSFVVALVLITIAMTRPDASSLWGTIGGLAFALSCAASCFGLLAIFLRWATTRVSAFDSLRDNAYGIYLVHYAAVSWLQYALLSAALPGLAKGILVFAASVAVSWATIAVLRRVPAVARVI